ncbi:MAG: hypothetical protein HYZ53_06945 [Planctomycetes bacterium]|nr:hypothetical protein [Planctomycetota bacterium]
MGEIPEPLRQAYNRCRVEEPLEVGDRRYVDLDGRGVRGADRSCNDFLFARIELSETPTHQLYSGFRGSGKSTELRRLAERLRGAGYNVVLIDTEDYLNLRIAPRVEDLLITIAAGVDRALGGGPPESLGTLRRFWDRLSGFLHTQILVEQVKVSPIPDVVDVELAFKGDVDFKKRLYAALEGRLPELARQCHEFLDEAIAVLGRRNPRAKGTVLILDSFEKLRAGDPRSAEDVRASVENVFIRDWKHLNLACHVIYTVPPWLAFMEAGAEAGATTQGGRLHILPMCKVLDPERRQPHPDGLEAMTEVLRRRMPMDQVFADPAMLLPLAEASGGYPRDLLRMAREVLLRAWMQPGEIPIPADRTAELVKRVLVDYVESYENSLVLDDLDLLAEVAETRSIANRTRTQLQRLADLFDHHFVLSYRNGRMWFDLHPLVRRTSKMSRKLKERDELRHRPVGGP